jgi:hypothetical protein
MLQNFRVLRSVENRTARILSKMHIGVPKEFHESAKSVRPRENVSLIASTQPTFV